MTKLLVQKSGSAGFNLAVAALFAASIAFALFAMPQSLLESVVAATGLPNLLPAAEPPLGLTARLGLMGVSAAGGFALVSLILRALDGPRRENIEDDVDWNAPPRLRRADAHPDAPARRPLLAEQELGEPQDYPSPLQTKPLHLSPETIFAAAPARDEGDDGQDSVPEKEFEQIEASADDWMTDAPEALAPSEPIASEGIDEPVTADRAEELPPISADPPSFHDWTPEEEPASAASEMPVWPLKEDDPSASSDALMARLALPEDRGGSISSLMERLDTGLAKIEWPLKEAGKDRRAPDPVADELRSALDDLQRIAGSRG